jgi:GNAT superfamily N-acetyltransferase
MLEIKTVEECGSALLDEFIELVDTVFIREKTRAGTLRYRYPNLFRAENFRNLFTAWLNDELLGTVAVREFSGTANGEFFRGAMVGLVGVRKEFRRQGVGKILIARVTEYLQREFDFSVLWTTAPHFYGSAGWLPEDNGILGHCHIPSKSRITLPAMLAKDAGEVIEKTRLQWQPICISRGPLDYAVMPMSVDEVVCVKTAGDASSSAYSIIGVKGDTGFVYEIVGNPELLPELWADVSSRFSEIFVNDCHGSASHTWLLQNTSTVWRKQNLAAWLTGNNGVDFRPVNVPFFDRI